jgi:excinuclease ABC subunit A
LIIQDRLKVTVRNKSRLTESFEQALALGKGTTAVSSAEGVLKTFTTSWAPLVKPTPSLFSFNSPLGACNNCRGFGKVIGIDLDKAIPNHLVSLRKGAIKPFQGERGEIANATS